MATMLQFLVTLGCVLATQAHLINPDADPVQTQPWSDCIGASSCGAGIQYRRVAGKIEFHPCNGKCSVDGGYSAWSEWSACSLSCGEGTKKRLRFCVDPEPANDGDGCPHGAVEEQFENCTTTCVQNMMPVDGNYTEWTEFHPCSVSCGNGTQVRERFCINPPPSNGGADCGNGLIDTETVDCSDNPCIDGGYTDWSPEVCTEVNPNGCSYIQCKEVRYCIDPPPRGGSDCDNGAVDVRMGSPSGFPSNAC